MHFPFNELSLKFLSSAGKLLLLAAAAATNPQSCQLNFQQPVPPTTPAQSASGQTAPVDTASVSRTADTCASLIDSPPRGLACLQCTQPQAREQAAEIASILADSCIKNLVISYLVDGTFSYDEELLKNHIELLTRGGRQLYLHLYLTNGPAQRRGASNSEQVFGSTIEPETFRRKILTDRSLQLEYENLVERLTPVLRYAEQRGAQISLVPMLEDNLNREAFMKMAQLTFEALPPDISASIGRSPCPGCYSGNDDDLPPGVFMESHSIAEGSSIHDSVITNDGQDFSLDRLRAARDSAEANNNIFIVWDSARQGRTKDANGRILRKPTNQRTYAIPDSVERQQLISFLRDGLLGP